jgi:hypothetical protein
MQKYSDMYFEVHVTIEPVEEERYDLFKSLSKEWGFWCSEWALKKENGYNFFATSRSKSYDDAFNRMDSLIKNLLNNKIKVLRYKIEDTVLDSKILDELEIISIKHPLIEDFDKVGV